jgi:ABC-type transport system substrate-binding protein
MTPCVALPSLRDVLLASTAGAAFLAGCSRSEPSSGWLHYLLGMEPSSLNPAKCFGGSEVSIMAAILEPLIRTHPETMSPIAGMAPSYKVEREGTRYTFYLHGPQSPEGIHAPGVESLPVEFTHSRVGSTHWVPSLKYAWNDQNSSNTFESIATGARRDA